MLPRAGLVSRPPATGLPAAPNVGACLGLCAYRRRVGATLSATEWSASRATQRRSRRAVPTPTRECRRRRSVLRTKRIDAAKRSVKRSTPTPSPRSSGWPPRSWTDCTGRRARAWAACRACQAHAGRRAGPVAAYTGLRRRATWARTLSRRRARSRPASSPPPGAAASARATRPERAGRPLQAPARRPVCARCGSTRCAIPTARCSRLPASQSPTSRRPWGTRTCRRQRATCTPVRRVSRSIVSRGSSV